MREWGEKRPHSPDTTSAPRPSARKRTRVGGKARNINKVVWRKVQQHLLWRNKSHMETEVFIDDVKQDFSNVRRRIVRAGATEIEHVKDRRSLSTLPKYIKLKPDLPEFTPPPDSEIGDGEPSSESAPQDQERVPPSPSSQSSCATNTESYELASEDDEDDIATNGNAFLGNLPLSELIDRLRTTSSWHCESLPHFACVSAPGCSHLHTVRMKDSLETLTEQLKQDPLIPREHISSHLEVILSLIREGEVSTSHFLETVIRRMNRRDLEILRWLARNIEGFSHFGARALGVAAYQNNFEVVDILLDEYVDINGSISDPHAARGCHCQINVITYAQLPRFDGEDSGASDEMVAYLLLRGATKSAGGNVGLLGLLECVVQQEGMDQTFRSKVRPIVYRLHDSGVTVSAISTFLETFILKSNSLWFTHPRLYAFIRLLEEKGKLSSSPLAALIYRYGQQKLSETLLAKVLEMTENINAYCHSVSLRKLSGGHDARAQPYNTIQSMNPLQAAGLCGTEEIIQLLLQYGADIDCPARGPGGVTPLQAICSLKRRFLDRTTRIRIAKLLLDSGANVNAAPAWNRGLSALQAVAFIGDVEVAELLVSRGANVNAPACKYGGGTALALAAREGHLDMVWFLLDKGAAIPAAGVKISSFGKTYEDNKTILDLLRTSASELVAMYGGNGTPSRDYREYEAEWKDDPTYENKG